MCDLTQLYTVFSNIVKYSTLRCLGNSQFQSSKYIINSSLSSVFKADWQDEYQVQVQCWLWIPSITEVDLDPTFTDSKAGLGAFVAEIHRTEREIALDRTWPDSGVNAHDFPAEGGTCGHVPRSSGYRRSRIRAFAASSMQKESSKL